MSTTITFDYSRGRARYLPVWQLCSAWLLLLPLIFLAARGTPSFESVESNNKASGTYGSLTAGSSSLNGARHILLLVVIYAIICAAIFPYYRQVLAAFQQNKLILSLIMLAFLSAGWSQVPSRSIAFSVFLLVNTAFAFSLLARFDHERQLQLFIFIGAVAVILSVVLVIGYPNAGIDHKQGGAHPWEGMFGHKNHLAIIMTYLLIPAFFVKVNSFIQRNLRNLYVLTVLFLIGMSQSRTGWLLVLATIAFVISLRVLRRYAPKDRALLIVGLVVCAAIVAGVGLMYAKEIAVALGKDPTLSGRTLVWKAVLAPILKHPWVGYGYNAFWIGLKGEAVSVALAVGSLNLGNAENGILDLWLQVGFIGVAIFLVSLMWLCRFAAVCFWHSTDNRADFYICIVFLAVASLIDGDKYMYPHTLEWTLYVLAYAGLRKEAETIVRRRDFTPMPTGYQPMGFARETR